MGGGGCGGNSGGGGGGGIDAISIGLVLLAALRLFLDLELAVVRAEYRDMSSSESDFFFFFNIKTNNNYLIIFLNFLIFLILFYLPIDKNL